MPPFSPCGMGVEFVRSAFKGYWRFYEDQPDLLAGGQYFFVPDSTPHVPWFHPFGSDFWREGDALPVVTDDPLPPRLGHDKSLPWQWVPGLPISDPPAATPVGDANTFQFVYTWPPNPIPKQIGGFDARCTFPCVPGPNQLVPDVFCFAINDCQYLAWVLQLQFLVGEFNHAAFEEAIKAVLGPGAVITFNDGNARFPPFAIVQTPRNTIVVHAGTNSPTQWREQLTNAYGGPTNVGPYSTLPLWFEGSTRVFNALRILGADPAIPLMVHGHSMGGAIAVNIAARFHAWNPLTRVRLHTSASPKPGDERLQNKIDAIERLHVAVYDDIVPRVPPSNLMKDVLQLALPFLPDSFFGTWVPYRQYLWFEAGGHWRYGSYYDRDPVWYVFVYTTYFLLGVVQAAFHHFGSFYVSSVRSHCPCPELPFTADSYASIYGTPDCYQFPFIIAGEGAFQGTGGGTTDLILEGAGGIKPNAAAELLLDGQGGDGRKPTALILNGAGKQIQRWVAGESCYERRTSRRRFLPGCIAACFRPEHRGSR